MDPPRRKRCEACDRVDVAGEHAFTSSSSLYGQSSNYLGSLNTHRLYGFEQVINDRYSVATFDKSAKVLRVNEFCWRIACLHIVTILNTFVFGALLWLAFACTAYDHIISRADKAMAICQWSIVLTLNCSLGANRVSVWSAYLNEKPNSRTLNFIIVSKF